MQSIELPTENIIKLEKIKQEPKGTVWNLQETFENTTFKCEVKEEEVDENDDDEEKEVELKPLVAIFLEEVVNPEFPGEAGVEGEEESFSKYGKDFSEGKDESSGFQGEICAAADACSDKSAGAACAQSVCSCSIDGEEPLIPTPTNHGGQSSKHRACKKYTSYKISNVHGRNGKNQMNECFICRKRFVQTVDLTLHQKTHIGEGALCCPICLKGFTVRMCLYKHMTTHSEDTPPRRLVSEKSCEKREPRPYCCYICSKDFMCRRRLYIHVKAHARLTLRRCPVCWENFRGKESLLQHVRDEHMICWQ